jgi:hypothetical protein
MRGLWSKASLGQTLHQKQTKGKKGLGCNSSVHLPSQLKYHQKKKTLHPPGCNSLLDGVPAPGVCVCISKGHQMCQKELAAI